MFLSWQPSELQVRSLDDLPPSFCVKLGDLGSALHRTELRFDSAEGYHVQSLPYRAPEVLFGCPFGTQADCWSVGVLLLELCLRRVLLAASTSEELVQQMAAVLSLDLRRYLGGLHFDALSALVSPAPFCLHRHVTAVRQLLVRSTAGASAELVDLLAALLHPDPDERLQPAEALQHRFLARELPLSLSAPPPPSYAHLRLLADRTALLREALRPAEESDGAYRNGGSKRSLDDLR